MCECTGDVKDVQRHIDIQLTDDEVTEAVKKILNEPEAVCAQTGLPPFCAINKLPAVRFIPYTFLKLPLFQYTLKLLSLCFNQGNNPFWSKKPPQDKPEKPTRPK